MARASEWANKVLALLRAGNDTAAVAQIKVAPSVRDLKSLQAALKLPPNAGRWSEVEVVVADNVDAMSAPRLHRSP
jgi:hypothetical protein